MVLQSLAASENVETMMVAGGLTIALVAILSTFICKAKKTRQREESRREIAAYIAEGSMTFEQGERLMKAGNDDDKD